MGKVYIERQLDDVPFSANGSKALDIPRNGVLRGISFRLVGTYTTGTGTWAKFDHSVYKLIQRIEIIANGKDTLKSVPFFFTRLLARADSGTLPDLTDVGNTASTAYPFVAYGFIPFAFTRARRPLDGALDTRKLSSLSLVVTWGTDTTMYGTLGSGGSFTVTPSLQVKLEEYANVEPDFKAAINRHSTIQHEVTATKVEDQEKLVIDRVYRRFFVYAEAAGMASNAIINKITLKSGTYVFKSVKGPMAQSSLKTLYGIDAVDTGLYVVDATTDGMLTEALNARGLTSLEFVFDVTKQAGTNIVYVIPEEVAEAA